MRKRETAWDGRPERLPIELQQTDKSGRSCVLPYALPGVKTIGG